MEAQSLDLAGSTLGYDTVKGGVMAAILPASDALSTEDRPVLNAAAVIGYIAIAILVLVVLVVLARLTVRAVTTAADIVRSLAARRPAKQPRHMRSRTMFSAEQRRSESTRAAYILLAILGILLGVIMGVNNAYDMTWFRSTDSVLSILVVFFLMWIAPFFAAWLVLRQSGRWRLTACLLLFASAYLWAWLTSHWDSIRYPNMG